jgi:hypothetical protein
MTAEFAWRLPITSPTFGEHNMADRLNLWTDPAQAQEELKKRLSQAKDKRKPFETMWETCLREAYLAKACNDLPGAFSNSGLWPSVTNVVGSGGQYLQSALYAQDEGGSADSDIYANYIQKNVRYTCSQLSANPPSVVPEPTSPDPKDRRAAQAANNVIKYAMRQYRLQESKDMAVLWMAVCGTGWLKVCHNPQLGDPLAFDPGTGVVTTTGDLDVYAPRLHDIFPDPTAKSMRDVRYIFERFELSCEWAQYYFGDAIKDRIDKNPAKDTVEVFQYWEKGLPTNGFLGRFCWCLDDGTVLADRIAPSPHGPLKKLSNGQEFRMATLPYHIITEIDIPGTFWGVSAVNFTVTTQQEVNTLDRVTMSNIRANGSSQLVCSEDCEIAEDSITNNPMDIIKYSGGVPPTLHAPNPVSAIIPQLREMYAGQISEIHGLNESQFGKQSRETSATAMQYSSQQGAALAGRTHTKYVQFIEDIYKDILIIVQEKWTLPRLISVEGKEKAFHTIQFQASDIAGGYEFKSKYGTDFSLDPIQRRQEILQLWPIFKEGGLDPRTLLSKLQLNDLESIFSEPELANDRQQDYIDRMLTSPTAEYIPPQDLEDHVNMVKFAKGYLMSAEFFHIDNEVVKANIKRHVKERIELAAKEVAEAAPAQADPAAAAAGAAPGAEAPPDLASLLGSGAGAPPSA